MVNFETLQFCSLISSQVDESSVLKKSLKPADSCYSAVFCRLRYFLVCLWKNIDKLNKCVQIIALIIAGVWAYSKFNETERPALELRASADCNLQINFSGEQETYFILFTATVQNLGKRSFDITSVRIRGWSDKGLKLDQQTTQFIDPNKTERLNPFFDSKFTSGSLIRHFSPGQAGYDSYQWLIRNPELIHFRIDFTTAQDMTIPYAYAYRFLIPVLVPSEPSLKK